MAPRRKSRDGERLGARPLAAGDPPAEHASGLLGVSISWLLHCVGTSPVDPLERLAAEKINSQLKS
jgi:hypothetical protein